MYTARCGRVKLIYVLAAGSCLLIAPLVQIAHRLNNTNNWSSLLPGHESPQLAPRIQRAWARVDHSCVGKCVRSSPNLSEEACDARCFQSFLQTLFTPPTDAHVDDCTANGYLKLYTRKEGLGSTIHGYMHALMRSTLRGMYVCENTGWSSYSNPYKCENGQKGMQCLFKPLGNTGSCATKMCEAIYTWPRSGGHSSKEDDTMAISSRCAIRGEREEEFSHGPSFMIHQHLIDSTHMSGIHNDHWYLKEVVAYMLRPNPRVQRVIEQLRNDLQLHHRSTKGENKERIGNEEQGGYMSVHIRRGDHVNSAQESRSDAEFVAATLRVASVTGVRVVLLCSDDFDALHYIPVALEAAGLRVALIPSHWSVLDQHRESCRGRNHLCKAVDFVNADSSGTQPENVPEMMDEGVLIAAMIWLMAEGVVSIGTLSSSIGRVVYMLMWQIHVQEKQQAASRTTSGGESTIDLDASERYLDVNGAKYVSCGWRRSAQSPVSLIEVIDSWESKWRNR